MDFDFTKDGKSLTAVDAGWKENGYSVFEILDDGGNLVDTLMVHPFDDIDNAVAEWLTL